MKLFRARTLQYYVLREFLFAFTLAVSACTMFMLLASLIMKADDYEELGLTAAKMVILIPFLLPYALVYSIPPAAMIAATIVFGRLSAENEILAAQAGGAPLRALALPMIICSVFLSVFCMWCYQGGITWGAAIIRDELQINKPEFFKNMEKEGTAINRKLENGDVVRINLLTRTHDPKSGVVRKPIYIAYFQNQLVGQTLLAQDCSFDYKISFTERKVLMTLHDAQVLGDRPAFFSELKWEIDLPPPSSFVMPGDTRSTKGWLQNYDDARLVRESLARRRHFMLARAAEFGAQAVAGSLADGGAIPAGVEQWGEARIAWEAIFSQAGALDRARADEAECWRKIAQSVLPFSAIFLGLGLGLLVKQSNRIVGFLLGLVVYFILDLPLMLVTREMASAHKLGLWCLFLPNLVLLAVGLIIWRSYERGAMPSWLSSTRFVNALKIGEELNLYKVLLQLTTGLVQIFNAVIYRPMLALRDQFVHVSPRKTDGYIVSSFLAALFVVICCVSVVYPVFDFVEHGTEVIQGVVKAGEPIPGSGLPIRGEGEAILDVITYYSIHSLKMICTLMPLLILVAGLLCVSAMVRNNEHLILKSSGRSLQRSFAPMIGVAVLFSLGVTTLQETELPRLIMLRNYLKPLIYHQNAQSTAVAIHTSDSKGNQVMFQMSQYDNKTQEGRNLRVYLLSEVKDRRIPVIVADRARWETDHWHLRMQPEPTAEELKKNKHLVLKPLNHGFLITPEFKNVASNPKLADLRTGFDIATDPVLNRKTPVENWHGAVSPSFLEFETLGSTGVLSLEQLSRAGELRPELRVEFWKRISEWVMGLFLLCMTIPFLLNDQVYGLVHGIAYSIVVGALYWGFTMGFTEYSRQHRLDMGPLVPHAVSMMASTWLYFYRMET